MRLGIDLMGGDRSPLYIFDAVLQARTELPSSAVLVVFVHYSICSELQQLFAESTLKNARAASIEFVSTEDVIDPEDPPLLAVRRKKNSSMVVGIRLLKEKKVDAFLSTGNTGALMASAMFHLSMLPGIERPALLVILPSGKHGVAVLDVGANIAPRPEHLIGYAKLGMIYRQCAHRIRTPTVGLLNIGTEQLKGTESIKEAYAALSAYFKDNRASFKGNVEARDVFGGAVDVLVTDGFTGNVFLKTCEGVSAFLIEYLASEKSTSETGTRLKQQFNVSKHPGALLCGVDGIVIKCHGNSDTPALISGIRGAAALVKSRMIEKMKERLNLS